MKSKKLLIVEDETDSQLVLHRLFKKNGFEKISVLDNGEEAVESAKRQQFDLIIMDMKMVAMDGFEAIKRSGELPEYEKIPIIALTGLAMRGDRERCLDAGATVYVSKPAENKFLIKTVNDLLEKSLVQV